MCYELSAEPPCLRGRPAMVGGAEPTGLGTQEKCAALSKPRGRPRKRRRQSGARILHYAVISDNRWSARDVDMLAGLGYFSRVSRDQGQVPGVSAHSMRSHRSLPTARDKTPTNHCLIVRCGSVRFEGLRAAVHRLQVTSSLGKSANGVACRGQRCSCEVASSLSCAKDAKMKTRCLKRSSGCRRRGERLWRPHVRLADTWWCHRPQQRPQHRPQQCRQQLSVSPPDRRMGHL
jgi:hypothetical protein